MRNFISTVVVIFILCFAFWPAQARLAEDSLRFNLQEHEMADWTIIGYFNGDNHALLGGYHEDNKLIQSILTIIDYKLEKIGSSDNVHVLILYDGGPDTTYYGQDFSGTKLLYLEKDSELKKINSRVLTEFKGEFDMGAPETLEKLITFAISSFPARHYMFLTFTHGRGILDGLSPDMTSKSGLSMKEFHDALKRGLGGKKFDGIIMLSCLMNMIEVNYALKDTTELFLGSPAPINLIAYPPEKLNKNSRDGIAFDKMIKKLENYPEITKEELTRFIIDASVEPYKKFTERYKKSKSRKLESFRRERPHSAYLAGINTEKIDGFMNCFRRFSKVLKSRLEDPQTQSETVELLLKVERNTRSYAGLSYYDLYDLFSKIAAYSGDNEIKALSNKVIQTFEELIIYERHEGLRETKSHGVGIYFPSPIMAERIFKTCQESYKESQFAKDTSWDEVIELFRTLTLAKNKTCPERNQRALQ